MGGTEGAAGGDCGGLELRTRGAPGVGSGSSGGHRGEPGAARLEAMGPPPPVSPVPPRCPRFSPPRAARPRCPRAATAARTGGRTGVDWEALGPSGRPCPLHPGSPELHDSREGFRGSGRARSGVQRAGLRYRREKQERGSLTCGGSLPLGTGRLRGAERLAGWVAGWVGGWVRPRRSHPHSRRAAPSPAPGGAGSLARQPPGLGPAPRERGRNGASRARGWWPQNGHRQHQKLDPAASFLVSGGSSSSGSLESECSV